MNVSFIHLAEEYQGIPADSGEKKTRDKNHKSP